MLLSSAPRSVIGKLVLNDVGMVVPKAALERISLYVGRDASFDSLDQLEAAMKTVSPFGNLAPAQWRHLAIHVSRRGDDGKWRFRYDPGIAVAFKAGEMKDVDLRIFWKTLANPVLVIRGAESDLLTQEIYDEMLMRPGTEGIAVPATGHAPMLMDEDQVAEVRGFLLA